MNYIRLPSNKTVRKSDTRMIRLPGWLTCLSCDQKVVGQTKYIDGSYSLAKQYCGSSYCLSCNRKKRIKALSGISHYHLDESHHAYFLTITPVNRIINIEQASSFRDGIREFLKLFLGAASVWEVVPKIQDGYTDISCPYVYDASFNVSDFLKHYVDNNRTSYSERLEIIEKRYNQLSIFHDWRCPICGSSGFLPVGHLHVHAFIVHNKRLDYSSLWEIARENGLGRIDLEILVDPDSVRKYLAKAVKHYLSKGNKYASYFENLYQAHYLYELGIKRTVQTYGVLYGNSIETRNSQYFEQVIFKNNDTVPGESLISPPESDLFISSTNFARVDTYSLVFSTQVFLSSKRSFVLSFSVVEGNVLVFENRSVLFRFPLGDSLTRSDWRLLRLKLIGSSDFIPSEKVTGSRKRLSAVYSRREVDLFFQILKKYLTVSIR